VSDNPNEAREAVADLDILDIPAFLRRQAGAGE